MSSYGSLVNNLYAREDGPEPQVGMGATYLGWSDRHAYTVIHVFSRKKIVIQRDKATRTDTNGMSDSQSYAYESDRAGVTFIVTKRKDGAWRIAKDASRDIEVGQTVLIGHRDEHFDFSY